MAARSSRAAPVQRRRRQLGGQGRHTLSVFTAGQPIADARPSAAIQTAAPIRATSVKRAYGPGPVTTRAVGLG